MVDLVNKLENYMNQRNLTRRELALRLGVSPDTIRKWFSGGESHYEPSEKNKLRILRLLESMGQSETEATLHQFNAFRSVGGTAVKENEKSTPIPLEPDWESLLKEDQRVTVRVAPSGDVSLTYLERDIIDTPEFQRLRGIKQLGTSYLVYPTAIHTRFDHSLGTLKEASQMIRQIKGNPQSARHQRDISPRDEVLIRLAALLHDVTHIPFGHAFEDECGILKSHDKDNKRYKKFLGEQSGIGQILLQRIGKHEYDKLLDILKTSHEDTPKLQDQAYINDVVGNTLCADLLDYVQRDSYFCHLEAEISIRFMKYLYIDTVDSAKRLIVRIWKRGKRGEEYPRRDVTSELIKLLNIRYSLAERVYYHHAKIPADAMLIRAVWEKVSNEWEEAKQPIECPVDFLDVGDERFLAMLSSTNDVSRKLVEGITGRQLHKRVWTLDRLTAQAKRHDLASFEKEYNRDPANRVYWENYLSYLVGANPGEVLIFCPPLDMQKKYAGMLIMWGLAPRPLNSIKEGDDLAISRSIQAILDLHDALWGITVVATKEIADDESRRKTLKSMCQALIEAPGPQRDELLSRALRDRVHAIASEEGRSATAVDAVTKEALVASRATSDAASIGIISDQWISEHLAAKS